MSPVQSHHPPKKHTSNFRNQVISIGEFAFKRIVCTISSRWRWVRQWPFNKSCEFPKWVFVTYLAEESTLFINGLIKNQVTAPRPKYWHKFHMCLLKHKWMFWNKFEFLASIDLLAVKYHITYRMNCKRDHFYCIHQMSNINNKVAFVSINSPVFIPLPHAHQIIARSNGG